MAADSYGGLIRAHQPNLWHHTSQQYGAVRLMLRCAAPSDQASAPRPSELTGANGRGAHTDLDEAAQGISNPFLLPDTQHPSQRLDVLALQPISCTRQGLAAAACRVCCSEVVHLRCISTCTCQQGVYLHLPLRQAGVCRPGSLSCSGGREASGAAAHAHHADKEQRGSHWCHPP